MRNEAKALPFAICDARTASIYEGTLVPGDRVHIERVDRLISPWLAFHDHGRPSLLAMGPTANARQWFADEHREPLELERRFAKDVAHWLKQHARIANGGMLTAFVAPHFLGALRGEIDGTRDGIALQRAALCGMRPHQIAAHRGVRELVRKALLPAPAIGALRTTT
jgi:hypothetical protein